MDNINLIEDYLPAYEELAQEDLYSTRERLVNYINTKFNDIDTVPNTVIGDLIVTPQAYTITAIEEGLNRILSDLNAENIANGIIYNCEFAKNWMSNFVNGPMFYKPASGVIRLYFSEAKNIVIDRSTQFKIGNDIFTLYLPYQGQFTTYLPGTSVPSEENGATLLDSGSGTYFCDVPVIGETNTAADTDAEPQNITAGTVASLSVNIDSLINAVALVDFDTGYTSKTPQEMAQLLKYTVYSASLNTRMGAIKFVKQACPFSESVYPILNGDKEALRCYRNQYGTATGCMDLYVRSKAYEFTETQTIRLYLSADKSAWEGTWSYTGQPYHIESITSDAAPELINIDSTITSTNTKNLGALAAYTPYEHFEIRIPDTLDEVGNSIYNPGVEELDGGGYKVYAEFKITYQTDPLLPSIAQTIENRDNAPINTSIMVRGFIPVVIDKFEIVYVREAGVVPDLETALTDVKYYLANLGAPDVYSDGEIARIMKSAGVKYMKNVNVQARIQWSIADKISNYEGIIEDVPTEPEITTSDGLRVSYPADGAVITPDTMYACSVRNIRYYLMENAVSFNEVKDI